MKALEILFTHPHFYIVNKPAGLPTDQQKYHESVESILLAKERELRHAKAYIGIVHRLDRPVNGLLVVARRKSALKALQQQFALRQIQKVYECILSTPLDKGGKLEHYHKRSEDRKKALISTTESPTTKVATLDIRNIDKLALGSHYRIILHTGRYHQIRAQLAFLGHPILGDSLYGGKTWPYPDAIALQSVLLSFSYDQEAFQFDCPFIY